MCSFSHKLTYSLFPPTYTWEVKLLSVLERNTLQNANNNHIDLHTFNRQDKVHYIHSKPRYVQEENPGL